MEWWKIRKRAKALENYYEEQKKQFKDIKKK